LKFHKLYTDDWSRRLTRLANIVLYIEDLLEEVDGEGVFIYESELYDPLVFDEITLNIKIKTNNRVELSPPEELKVSIEPVEYIDYNNMHILYDVAVRWFLNYAYNELGKYIIQTDKAGIEYYLAILEDGHVFLAEGEKYHIRIPFIKTYYLAHIHPTPHLMFSHHDIDVVIDTFTYGGLASVVLTRTGCTCIYRRGYFTDEDYYRLINLRKYLSKREINMNEVKRILGEGNLRLFIKIL